MTALNQVGYDGVFNREIPGENRCPMGVRLLKLDYIRKLGEWMVGKGRNGV